MKFLTILYMWPDSFICWVGYLVQGGGGGGSIFWDIIPMPIFSSFYSNYPGV